MVCASAVTQQNNHVVSLLFSRKAVGKHTHKRKQVYSVLQIYELHDDGMHFIKGLKAFQH